MIRKFTTDLTGQISPAGPLAVRSPPCETGTKEAPWKCSDLPMSLSFDGRIWLIGGWYNGRLPGHGASREVWSSTDGVNWTMATKDAGWSPRFAAGAVVFKGRMWILGGTEDYYFGDDASLKNDVWSSADGEDWKRETASAPWSPRAYHAAVVHDGKLWVIGEIGRAHV